MTVLRYFFRRLRALWRSDDIHDEIAEEMRFHIELRAEENVRRGMTPEEALTLIGIGLGLAGAFALSWALARFLFGVTATDPLESYLHSARNE